MKLTINEIGLISRLLELASNRFSYNTCNDTPIEWWEGWAQEEKDSLVYDYNSWNGAEEAVNNKAEFMGDWMLMGHFSRKFKKLADELA